MTGNLNELNDLLGKSESAYIKLESSQYKAEEELADKYRQFVTEILKLALAGFGVFSFLYKSGLPKMAECLQVKDWVALTGVGMFALSALSALLFLYFASEGLRWYIAGLRCRTLTDAEYQALDIPEKASTKEEMIQKYLEQRLQIIRICRTSKLLAAILLAAASVTMMAALMPWPSYTTNLPSACQNPVANNGQ